MCTVNPQQITLGSAKVTAFKVVNPYRRSLLDPYWRVSLEYWPYFGESLHYEANTFVDSPDGPGIMAFLDEKSANAEASKFPSRAMVIKLEIKLENVRFGYHHGSVIICAPRVYVAS